MECICILISLGQKINSIKRLLALNEELIKELIPQIGLRASFLYSWKRLTSISTIQGENSKEIFSSVLFTNDIPILIESVPISNESDVSKVSEEPEKLTLNHSVEHSELNFEELSSSSVSSNLDLIQEKKAI